MQPQEICLCWAKRKKKLGKIQILLFGFKLLLFLCWSNLHENALFYEEKLNNNHADTPWAKASSWRLCRQIWLISCMFFFYFNEFYKEKYCSSELLHFHFHSQLLKCFVLLIPLGFSFLLGAIIHDKLGNAPVTNQCTSKATTGYFIFISMYILKNISV